MVNEKSSVPHIQSSFFMRQVTFGDGRLIITVGDSNLIHTQITFDYVRTFLFFKESDFFTELGMYEHEKIIGGNEAAGGVYRILKKPIIASLLQGRLDQERPSYFWLSTPDECLEIVAFSEPELVRISSLLDRPI